LVVFGVVAGVAVVFAAVVFEVVAAAPVLFSLYRMSGVPSFFKCAGGVLFSLKRLSGVPSFFKCVVLAEVVAAGLVEGVVCAIVIPAKVSNKLTIRVIFFIFRCFSVIGI
jgi:hypothetical protein